MSAANSLVFLPGAEDLRRIFPSWPEKMRLALCLGPGGTSGFLVFRVEEGARVLFRAAEFLDLPVEDLPVVPSIAGHPTEQVRFSDEQHLLALIAGADAAAVTEAANDYDINFRFAVEEGLDHERLVTSAPAAPIRHDMRASPAARGPRLHLSGLRVSETASETASGTAGESEAAGAPVSGSQPRSPRLRFDESGRVAPIPVPPPGFHAVQRRPRDRKGVMRLVADDMIEVEIRDGGCAEARREVETLFMRDDMRALALPGAQVMVGQAMASVIAFPSDLLPTAFVERLAQGAFEVKLASAGDFVQIVPDLTRTLAEPAAPTASAAVIAKVAPQAEGVKPAAAPVRAPIAPPRRNSVLGRVMGGGLAAVGLSAVLAVALQAADRPGPERAPDGAAPVVDLRAKLFPESK